MSSGDNVETLKRFGSSDDAGDPTLIAMKVAARRQQKTMSTLITVIALLIVVSIVLGTFVFRLAKKPADIFRHVPQVKAEIIHTPGIAPPLLGPECEPGYFLNLSVLD